ncbi:cation/H(+) antiporter 15-like [Abrus precatorius]|uniref:Cation/H(+) antiporter 15-like n=1 Tax=Abrus precatorius TaxID=3816 RepID=A0A8B8K1A8_ABRPR|nr:cation/H(+) antiporter 15-like [Abrus precatorius]
MEPGNGNLTLVCQDPHGYGHNDIWHLGNPLDSPTCLLLVQVALITVVTQFIDICLKPLGQSSLVSQILGGVVFGPSVIGKQKMLANILFPARGVVVLDTVASFGLMFFFFIWCVKMDLATLLRTEKHAIVIGFSVFSFTLVIPTGVSFLMRKYVAMNKTLSHALPFVAFSQTLTVFISIAVLLTDLKILNTDIGRLTMSAAMFADIIGFISTVIMFSILQNKSGSMLTLTWIILSIVALLLVILFVMRPLILWIVKRSGGDSVNEFCVVCIFVFVMIAGLLSELIGQHFAMGPIILGLAVPEGPPLGTTLVRKMETICLAFLYPIYLAVNGLQTDIFRIDARSAWIVSVVVMLAFIVKIGAVMLPGYYSNVSLKESCVIGLLLNGRGIAELTMYNMWKGSKLLSDQEFSLMVVQILVINVIITPLIKLLYDPSEQYHTGRRCSIQHTRRDSELRIMVCIYNNENIPTILNLLEASYASRESTVAVIALVLVELLGRARPILVAHQPHDTLRSMSCNSNHIDNALRQYAQQNEGLVSVQSFTSISNFDTKYDDICRISLDRRANILILPFHKRWEIDGSVEVTQRSIQIMNVKVLERAPCSVGILVDRGILSGSPSLLMAKATFYVAVLFIGGADDAEALAYGTRMARHECVSVTVVRFLLFGEENSKDRKRDSDLIDEYRYYNAGNRRFEVIDEVVKDGIEMSTCIRRFIDYFDLVMVGREHQDCAMLQGHDQWSECPELGVIGDMLASQDFVTKASVLVVQQQRIRGRFVKQSLNAMPNQRDQLVHDFPIDETSRPSCTISVDRCEKM